MVAPKKISVKKAIKAPVKKNMPSMDAQAPKMTEKVTSKKEESCCGILNCSTWSCNCACCKKVTFLYFLIFLFLVASLTKHVYFYAMYGKSHIGDNDGRGYTGQQYEPGQVK